MKHFVKDSYFEVVADVSNTWLQVKKIPDFKTVVGVELFTRMLELAPDAWGVFPWSEGLQHDEDLFANKRFVIFAGNFVSMLDMAIDMLGPDLELVEGQLQLLGIRHISYGVMPKHYPLMGKALLNTLEHLLGDDDFNMKRHDSWNAMYTFMSVTMMQGAFQELVRVYDEKNKADLQSSVKQEKSSRRKVRDESVRTVTTSGTSSSCHDEDNSITSSSLDDICICNTSRDRKSDHVKDFRSGSSSSNNNRKSLFSSSEFVKRFTRGTKNVNVV